MASLNLPDGGSITADTREARLSYCDKHEAKATAGWLQSGDPASAQLASAGSARRPEKDVLMSKDENDLYAAFVKPSEPSVPLSEGLKRTLVVFLVLIGAAGLLVLIAHL